MILIEISASLTGNHPIPSRVWSINMKRACHQMHASRLGSKEKKDCKKT